MITGKQVRAARVLAGWDIKDLAPLAGLSTTAVQNIETGATPKSSTIERIVNAFSNAGIEFIEGQGVRFRANDIEVFEGPERFENFTDFVYNYLKHNGGDVCISAVDEGKFAEHRKNQAQYQARMKKLIDRGDVSVRILASKSKFKSIFAQYKWQPEQDNSVPTSFYAFGDCLALISFAHQSAPYVVLHKSGPFAAAFIDAFNRDWDNAQEPPKSQEQE